MSTSTGTESTAAMIIIGNRYQLFSTVHSTFGSTRGRPIIHSQ